MFVDEDCVDSRSDVDDLRTRDCLYDESRQVRYEGCCIYCHNVWLTSSDDRQGLRGTQHHYSTGVDALGSKHDEVSPH